MTKHAKSTGPERPESLFYAVDDRPPLTVTLLSGLQQAVVSVAIGVAVLSVVLDAPEPPTELPTFAADLVLPFAIGALACCLRGIGDVTTAQRLNDTRWVRPDLTSIEGGLVASGVGNVLAGLLGTTGANTASSGVGLSGVTGITARVVGLAAGGILVALAFLPAVATTFAIMPRAIVGAVLLFTGCMVMVNGIQVITSRVLDIRKTFVIGLPTILGLTLAGAPALFVGVPPWLKPFFQSPFVLSILTALALNAVFRIGVRKTATLTIDLAQDASARAIHFVQRQGGAWGARQDIMQRVERAVGEMAEIALAVGTPGGKFVVTASFDEFRIDVAASYPGPPFVLGDRPPTTEELILSCDEGPVELASLLVTRSADRIQARHDAGVNHIQLEFDQ